MECTAALVLLRTPVLCENTQSNRVRLLNAAVQLVELDYVY